MPHVITTYCSKAWADAFFTEYRYSDIWNEASDEKRISALRTSTEFIDIFIRWFTADGEQCEYGHAGDELDEGDHISPQWLKILCCHEAAYLLSLDDNPAEPHPLTILGIVKTGTTVFDSKDDRRYTPPLFPSIVLAMAQNNGGVVNSSANGSASMMFFQKQPAL